MRVSQMPNGSCIRKQTVCNLLVVDVSNIANMAFHTTGKLEFEDMPTGVLYGMYRKLEAVSRDYDIDDYAFCFDSKHSKRTELFPDYKIKRKLKKAQETEEQQAARQGMYRQVREFYRLVHEGGCTNTFGAAGYEADDVVASVIQNLPYSVKRAYILSSDEDLYQLLDEKRVMMIKPKAGLYTHRKFTEEYGVPPVQWPSVKSWAGCSSDDIPGLKGIGPKKACQFLLGKYPKPETFYSQIETYTRNIELTYLPFPGCPKFQVTTGQGINWEPLKEFISVDDSLPRGVK